ncbi:MAG TPA: helix-turn-helix transcriptional regulator [Chthonomonadaceae bacterium]|nr:helix-turn-helix transcriptional regulator [Chthonomonadaceae bacterium]
MRELLKGNTPTVVLAVLSEGPQHTYAIGRIIVERVGDAVPFKRGTLYPVLHALERDGLVVGNWQHVDGERPRCIYSITPAGRAVLARRAQQWNRFADAMSSLIGGIPHEQTS